MSDVHIKKRTIKGEVMKVHNLFVSLAMFFVLTAASFAQQAKTDYDRSVNFDQ